MTHNDSALAKFFHVIDRIVYQIEEKAVAISVLMLAAILVINVFLRSFNSSLASAEELSQFLMFYITFLGTSYAARSGMHIRMSMLSDALRGKAKKALAVFVSFGTMVVMFYVAWLSFKYVMKVASLNRVSPILQWHVQYIWMVMPIGMCLTGIQYMLAFIRNLTTPGTWISYSVQNEYEPTALSNFDEQVMKAGEAQESASAKKEICL